MEGGAAYPTAASSGTVAICTWSGPDPPPSQRFGWRGAPARLRGDSSAATRTGRRPPGLGTRRRPPPRSPGALAAPNRGTS
eukprot:scaffold5100_cov61-Phaeocystis_antarctica.AAC.7